MRIVGLPGEQVVITNNLLVIDGVPLTQMDAPPPLLHGLWSPESLLSLKSQRSWILAEQEVFVVGDNLLDAHDSRYWGPVNLSMVLGVVKGGAD